MSSISDELAIRLYNAENAFGWGACFGMLIGLLAVGIYVWLDGGFAAQ